MASYFSNNIFPMKSLYHQIKRNANSDKQIIFIHGNSQSSEVWQYLFNEPALSDYNLICFDLSGHGKSFNSSSPESDYTLKQIATCVAENIKQFDKNPYILVGNSLGGNIIAEMIFQIKNCIGIFITGPCIIGSEAGFDKVFLPNPNAGVSFAPSSTEEQINALINDTVYGVSQEIKQLIKTEFLNTDKMVRQVLGTSFANADYTDELQNLKASNIPLAFVFGKQEKLCNIHYLDNLNIPMWNNRPHLIENSGHFTHLDQPKSTAFLLKQFAESVF